MTIINLLHVSVSGLSSQTFFQVGAISYTPNALIEICIPRTGITTFSRMMHTYIKALGSYSFVLKYSLRMAPRRRNT